MRTLFVCLFLLFCSTITNAQNNTNTLTDVLNSGILRSAANNTDTEFTTKEQLSGAVYSGRMAKQTSYFEAPLCIKASSDIGIVTTQSMGTVAKITVNWNINTRKGATLVVYGKTTPYTTSADLYADDAKGDSLTTFVCDSITSESDEYTLSGDINYVGFVNNSSLSSFVNSIEIEWSTSKDAFQFSKHEISAKMGEAITVPTLTNTYSTTEITYTSSYNQVATVDETSGAVTPVKVGTTRITATLNGTNISDSYILTVLPSTGYTYHRVTSTDELVEGCHFLFVAFNGGRAKFMCNEGTQSESSKVTVRKAYDFSDISITKDSSLISNVRIMTSASEKEKAAEFMLEKVLNGSKTYCAFRDNVCEGWLGKKPKSSGNYLLTSESRLLGCLADVSFNDDETAQCLFGTSAPLHVRYAPTPQYFACYETVSENQLDIYLYRRFDPAMMDTLTLNAEGYCTYYSEHAYTMPEDVKGGIITATNGKTLTVDYCYSSGAVVPARTALLMKGTAGKQHICFFTESDEPAPANNLLHGADAIDANGYTSVGGTGTKYYILSHDVNGKNLGFYWAAADGGAIAYQPDYAFLAIEDVNNSASFFLDDNTTAIDRAAIDHNAVDIIPNNRIYTITGHYAGHDVNMLSPGIYITNGSMFVK